MDENIYIRQQNISLNIPEKVSVIGCGGAGSWTAMFLAIVGAKEIDIYDADIIESHNLNRTPYPYAFVGVPKTDALVKVIEELRPGIKINVHSAIKADTDMIPLINSDSVFDCTDDGDIQHEIWKFCVENDIKYTKIGYDGFHITLSDNIPDWSTGNETRGYDAPPTSSFVVSSVMVAALGVLSELTGRSNNLSLDIRKILKNTRG